MSAKLRHIALSVPDPEKAAQMFEQAFGMERCGKSPIGIYMTDGTMNLALLNYPKGIPGFPKEQEFWGVTHFGMWVDDVKESAEKCEALGCKHLMGNIEAKPGVYYEVKYTDPNGIVFDLTTSGWHGAVRDVVPAGKAQAAE